MRYLVRPQTTSPIAYAAGRFKAGVTAAVVNQVGLPRGDRSVFLDPSFESHYGWMPRVTGHQLLYVGHDHPHRTPGCLRQPKSKVRVHKPALAAKVAAYGRSIDPNLVSGHVNTF